MFTVDITSLLSIAASLAAVLIADRTINYDRYMFNQKFLTVVVVFIIGFFLVGALGSPTLVLAVSVVILIMSFAIGRWVTYRIQDCGWPRWIRFLYVLPGIGFLLAIVVMFPPSKAVETTDPDIFD